MSSASSQSAAARGARQRSRDLFGWVLIASMLAHVVVVFGISFVMPSQAGNRDFSPPMKIMLVSTPSEQAPDEANALAQSDSVGEADAEEPPLLAMSTRAASAGAQRERERLLMEEQANAWLNPAPEESATPGEAVPLENRETLVEQIDVAFLNARAQPRERYVHSSTRASELAPYLESWRLQTERVGNLNYPDAARRDRIEGELVLDVAVRADGSVEGVDILRSSGHKVLDDGAERIVTIAAPFEPFSEEMRRDYDILHIIRTWRFSRNTVTDVTR